MRCYICGSPAIVGLCPACQEKRAGRAAEKAMMTPKLAGWSALDRWLVYAFTSGLVASVLVAAWNKGESVPTNSVVKAVPAAVAVKKAERPAELSFEAPEPSPNVPAVKPPRPPK